MFTIVVSLTRDPMTGSARVTECRTMHAAFARSVDLVTLFATGFKDVFLHSPVDIWDITTIVDTIVVCSRHELLRLQGPNITSP